MADNGKTAITNRSVNKNGFEIATRIDDLRLTNMIVWAVLVSAVALIIIWPIVGLVIGCSGLWYVSVGWCLSLAGVCDEVKVRSCCYK